MILADKSTEILQNLTTKSSYFLVKAYSSILILW